MLRPFKLSKKHENTSVEKKRVKNAVENKAFF